VILVDTSVWIEHLRAGDGRHRALLDAGKVLGHPFVIGELALGDLRGREAFLRDLPRAAFVAVEEMLSFIERQGLSGRGIGYVDTRLLAAARLTADARLWTLDQRLQAVAAELGLAAMLAH
jgi:predicted nucleic acid-binding protein